MKSHLTNKLKQLGAFWSYDIGALKNLPDSILIEECLRWGDVSEILELFKLFTTKEIKVVWKEKLIPDERIYAHNYYLASVFFNIQNAKRYIKTIYKKNNRYERIRTFVD